MDGPDPPTPSSKALVSRVFEATRLADEFIAAAYDRLFAAAESVGAAKPSPRPSGRRTAVAAPTPTGGRGR
jgi:hypothetical protein